MHRAGNRKYKYLPDSPKAQTKSPGYTGVDPITADPTAKDYTTRGGVTLTYPNLDTWKSPRYTGVDPITADPTAKDYTTRGGVTLPYTNLDKWKIGKVLNLDKTKFSNISVNLSPQYSHSHK